MSVTQPSLWLAQNSSLSTTLSACPYGSCIVAVAPVSRATKRPMIESMVGTQSRIGMMVVCPRIG